MKMQFKVVVKQGPETLHEIIGRPDVISSENLTVKDVHEDVLLVEQALERLTGYRWHVEQVL